MAINCNNAGKISSNLLRIRGISQVAFEYVESFLFAIKYIRKSPGFYFPSFSDFAYRSRVETRIRDHTNESFADKYWFEKMMVVNEIKESLPPSLKEFYQCFYEEEVDLNEIAQRMKIGTRTLYRKKDLNRIYIVEVVERATGIVPYDQFWIKKENLE